MRHKNDSY